MYYYTLLLISLFKVTLSNENNIMEILHGKRDEILSRKKRFLIFPEGSSVQIGNISYN